MARRYFDGYSITASYRPGAANGPGRSPFPACRLTKFLVCFPWQVDNYKGSIA